MSQLSISTRVLRLLRIINDFEKGIIRVPAFQRDFEWSYSKKVELFESILKGLPIGTIFLWRPDFIDYENYKLFESNSIGGYNLPDRAIDYYYVLDGLQRLSTLFGCLIDEKQTPLSKDQKLWKEQGFNLIYNLESNKIEKGKKNLSLFEIELHKFIDHNSYAEFIDKLYQENYSSEKKQVYRDRYVHFQRQITTFDLPIVELTGAGIDEAVEIFDKLNSTGAKVTSEWKLNALSFNIKENFRLGNEIDRLLIELKKYNFQNLDRKVVFNSIVNSFGIVFFDKSSENDNKKIEKLANDPSFIENTRKTIEAIKKAVEFLFNELLVIDDKLLPYNNQLIFITDFFNKVDKPTPTQLRILKKWFWVTTYSNYFTIYNLSKQRKAYEKFQNFIYNESDPLYYDVANKTFVTEIFPKKISMGSVRGKALALFMLNHSNEFKPLNEKKNIELNIVKVFDVIPNKRTNEILMFDNSSENSIVFYQKPDGKSIEFGDKKFFLGNLIDDPVEFLKKRKEEIIDEEMKFVGSLGITYNLSDSIIDGGEF
ncbi:hypothetical protein BWK59_06155 [Flavobacterium davisii]|uniref:GmrSD restriction endonucleases N-terminal domain-containing protein n=1 Tax=Flavobacterium davisii TaxID=2906077 RepID=A0A246GJK5_9FLAO|nr:DUF262 domain-containing protein [Flavobacterium davisii]OWP84292.1 hypothetical protein BWK59_06155 [Flavobacterium davisii]